MVKLPLAFAIALSLCSGSLKAEYWSGLYTSTAAPKPKPAPSSEQQVVVDDNSVCLAEILKAQVKHGIPDNLLLAIGIQEAGWNSRTGLTVWPWSVNAEGTGAFFKSKAAMVNWVRNQQAQGVQSIDVGCMQINQKWHGKAFVSLEHAADPRLNVDYAARYLRSLYLEEGNWWQAAGRYHSSTQKFKEIYLTSLAQNQRVANTKAGEIQARFSMTAPEPQQVAVAPPKVPAPSVFWGTEAAADKNAGSFSIYSNHPIRPVLPGYRELF
jgi:hypothetical protein